MVKKTGMMNLKSTDRRREEFGYRDNESKSDRGPKFVRLSKRLFCGSHPQISSAKEGESRIISADIIRIELTNGHGRQNLS